MLTKEAIKYGRKILIENDVDEREARLLLAHAINVSPSDLIRYDECTEGDFYRYTEYLNRRIAGEPFAYIVGEKEFMKLKFLVNKNVLVPREDTEILVLEAIKQCKKKILDLCTGSGCIAISLSKYIQNAEIDASDINARTLSVAKKNAILNEANVAKSRNINDYNHIWLGYPLSNNNEFLPITLSSLVVRVVLVLIVNILSQP